jgi:5-amino-6-(5-phosphoribosylamino)uracil reductase
MHDFQILFDHSERSDLLDPVYSPYGKLGFPHAPADRPWIYANFVQTLDGIVSLLGENASGSDIAQSEEDRWLMDLLRAHADAVLLGLGTLFVEKQLGRPRPRGPVFRIVEPTLQQLRAKLRRGPERNIFVTKSGNLQLADYAVFDGDRVDTAIITTAVGAARLQPQQATHTHVKIIIAGAGDQVDLVGAMKILRQELGIKYLLCEGGPQLYGGMIRADLIDEKFLTVSPLDVGQEIPPEQKSVPWAQPAVRPTIFSGSGFTKEKVARWQWLSCRKVGDWQFNRYRRLRS